MQNETYRDLWVRRTLVAIPAGKALLDVGAGEQPYRSSANHLIYSAQDSANYDGHGSGEGLQTGTWDYSGLDFVCDLMEIPEDKTYDAVLCTEVLEHVPDPCAALDKLARLVRPGGTLIVTAPFASMTHFAPFHFATGFSRYFYETHLPRLGFEITSLENNGGFFDYVAQEMGRSKRVYRTHIDSRPPLLERAIVKLATSVMRRWAKRDAGKHQGRGSAELATFGWHVIATKRSDITAQDIDQPFVSTATTNPNNVAGYGAEPFKWTRLSVPLPPLKGKDCSS